MGTVLTTAVAFESAFQHEVEMVLQALNEAGVPAAEVGQTNLGALHFRAGVELSPEAFWYVMVPSDQLATALKIVAALPVSRPELPVEPTGEAERHWGSLPLIVGTAALLLVALYLGRCWVPKPVTASLKRRRLLPAQPAA
jgi:hypothetical protein